MEVFLSKQGFWYFVFGLMLCLAIFGNILIIWIIIGNRRMHSITNLFLFNLSLADLTMASFNGIPNHIYMIQNKWVFGSTLCTVNNFMAFLTVSSSVFTMTAISIDRYIAIIQPLKPRMTKGSARRAICAIWFCSGAIALPSLIFSKTVSVTSGGREMCMVRWPDDKFPSDSKIDFGYNICFLVVTYVIPMGAMGICYGAMCKELWSQGQIGESTERQLLALVAKRKIVKMFIVIVVSFAICWFPYHAYFIYQYFDKTVAYKSWAQDVYLSFYWLAMSTSMVNPIIYYFMNSRFRACIRAVASRLFCQKNQTMETFDLTRRPVAPPPMVYTREFSAPPNPYHSRGRTLTETLDNKNSAYQLKPCRNDSQNTGRPTAVTTYC